MQTIQHTLVSSRLAKVDLRRLLGRVHLGPLGAKIAVMLLFTICWFLVALVRSNAAGSTLEDSSLAGLAVYMQHGAVSGRDFQSIFGPAAQILGLAASSLTRLRSPADASGMIAFVSCSLSAILIAALLFLCDRISWKDSAIFYAFCFLLNLFFQALDFRTALLLLNAAFAYRIVASETMRSQFIWATAAGLLAFISQLVTFELGIYSIVAVVCGVIAGSAMTRSARVLLGVETFVATVAVLNVALVILFRLTSASHGLAFDYYSYSLEILRGRRNSMGMVWQLPWRETLVLALASLYVCARCVMFARDLHPLDASLFAGFAVAAVIWVKTSLVTSDIGHISAAFTPLILILGLMSSREWRSSRTLAAWAAAVCAVFFVWPSLSLSAPADVLKVMRGEPRLGALVRNLYAPQTRGPADRMPSWIGSDLVDRRNAPVLSFPYDDYIGAGTLRLFPAPVLESYAASTVALERYYIQQLEKQRPQGLDITYGSDERSIAAAGGSQAITRSPDIFEYLYRNFELVGAEDHADGHYRLRERYFGDVAMKQLPVSTVHQLVDSGVLKLSSPSTCGLIRMQVRIEYANSLMFFRPGGIEVKLSDEGRLVWRGTITPVEPNQSFVTFISPLPPDLFHKVFGPGPVPGVKWDAVEYRNLPVDVLGAKPQRIQVERLHCIDPQKFDSARSWSDSAR